MGANRFVVLGRWTVDNADLAGAYLRSLIGAARQGALFKDVRNYCMFLGYPRSGHSLVGSLLDAHPHAVVAHELDALRYVRMGFGRNQLFWLILERDRWFGQRGREWTGYQYEVPGQWQGRFERLLVIGDKKGWCSTVRLGRRPALLDTLRAKIDAGLRVIHHVRNPFDNISTMWKKSTTPVPLERTIDEYFALCRTVWTILPRLAPQEQAYSRHETMVADPQAELGRLLAFLGLTATADYLESCARLVFPSPKQSRSEAPWTGPLRDRVRAGIAEYEFLHGYDFDN